MKGRVLIAATAAALMALPGTALADTGDLTPRNCYNDLGGAEDCLGSNQGLGGAQSVAVSPDGKSVYVASQFDDAIVIYDRNTTTGQIFPAGCIDDNDTGPDTCAQTTDGLDAPVSVAVSPDNKSVYVASANDDAIVRFTRSTSTGDLTPQGCIDDNDTGPEPCAQTADGLDLAFSVAVSPDNKSVYVASASDDAIVRFTRNTTSGALTPAGCIDDNDTGPEPCAQTADGLDGAFGVAVSPDGKSVYVAALVDAAVASFTRNTTSGALTVAGCIDDNDTGPDTCLQSTDGLDGAVSVAVSPDNKSVYVASTNDDAIVRFSRDTSSGALTRKGCIIDRGSLAENCFASARGLDGAISVAVSPDNKSVYVASQFDDAIALFERNTTTGSLATMGCVDDNDTGPDVCAQTADGLDGAISVAVSPDNKSVYVASFNDSAILRLIRAL